MDSNEAQQSLHRATSRLEKVTFWGIFVACLIVVYGLVKDVVG